MQRFNLNRFWSKVRKTDNCWFWVAGCMGKGYGSFRIGGKIYLAHIVSFYIHNGFWPKKCILHSCDNRSCVNPAHLREGTKKDNAEDRELRNSWDRSGSKNGRAVLTESQVIEIRKLNKLHCISSYELAKQFHVSRTTINHAVNGATWKTIIH